MNNDEKKIEYLEEYIPEMAKAAVKLAYLDALASGSSVMISDEKGVLKENFPDGTFKIVGKGEPFVKARKGEIIKIK